MQNNWFKGALGQTFLKTETSKVTALVEGLYGNHLLYLGEIPFIEAIEKSPISHRIWIHPQATYRKECSSIACREDKLGIGSDEIHVMYLAHCLEFVNNPHEVLRESFRVLVPEGHVVISSFNPWGLWGLWRLFGNLGKKWPWSGRFISVTRLKDWLALLGFDIISVDFYFFRPPVIFRSVLEKLKGLEPLGNFLWPILGGSYVVLAKKRVIPLTPIRPVWSKKEKLIVEGLVEPTTRNSS